MNSTTTIAAKQYRLQEWAAQIKDCQNRPTNMSVADWCIGHGITKANYYYRLGRVRRACLENLPAQIISQQIAPVKPELLRTAQRAFTDPVPGLDIIIQGVCVHVTQSTPMHLLEKVLEVVKHAE